MRDSQKLTVSETVTNYVPRVTKKNLARPDKCGVMLKVDTSKFCYTVEKLQVTLRNTNTQRRASKPFMLSSMNKYDITIYFTDNSRQLARRQHHVAGCSIARDEPKL